MKIEKAISEDRATLTKITKESKAYWGYSAEQMERWSDQLTITEKHFVQNDVFKLIDSGRIIGYYSYYLPDPSSVKLDSLFVDPLFIGKGYGAILLNDFINRATRLEPTEIILDSDPFAEAFYAKFGFEKIGVMPTSTPGRFLPKMRLLLKP